jgi:hypothetical protein
MRHWLAALMLTAISTGSQWHVQWNPQPDEFALAVVTKCMDGDRIAFFVWDEFPLADIGQDEADVRRQVTPPGRRCTVEITVMVSGDEGLHEAMSSESTIVIQQD